MKLKHLTISNILSYSFIENFNQHSPTITFGDTINILTGPNGSGKSNLLEVIHILFFRHFNRQFDLNEELLNQHAPIQGTIRKNERELVTTSPVTIPKHFSASDTISKVRLVVTADNNDLENLNFLKLNWQDLKNNYTDYTNGAESSIFESNYRISEIPFHMNEITFDFQINIESSSFSISRPELRSHSFERFFYDYLVDFNLIQRLFEVTNRRKMTNSIKITSPFSMISSLRQHMGFNPRITLGTNLQTQVRQAVVDNVVISTKNYSNAEIEFRYVMATIGLELNRLVFEDKFSQRQQLLIDSSSGALYSINKYLNSTLGLSLKFGNDSTAGFYTELLIFDKKIEVKFDQLSAGQKSIFFLLFVVFGSNFKNGLLIIDEPELHLHTSMQIKYKKLLIDIQKEANVQVIIATHSAAFVDETTIHNVFRIYKPENSSIVYKPEKIGTSEKELVKMLTYTNCSRIFFADKVVLVEGDSDEYFFKYFLENHFLLNYNVDSSIEIVYIGGKGQYKKWSKFLNLYKIPHYFIGDLDNIKELGITTAVGLNMDRIIKDGKEEIIKKLLNDTVKVESLDGKSLLKILDTYIKNNFKADESEKEKLKLLWAYLVDRQSMRLQYVLQHVNKTGNEKLNHSLHSEIENKYNHNIFILKQGDLETYINRRNKDLQSIISFCNEEFENWIVQENLLPLSDSKLAELVNIFKYITNSKVSSQDEDRSLN